MAAKRAKASDTKIGSATNSAARKTSATKASTAKAVASKAARAKSAPAGKAAATKVSGKTAAKASSQTAAKVAGRRSSAKKTAESDKYSDPALRDRIKAKVVREGRGGRPGQWSARKAQMVAHEYEAAGGKYKGGRDEQQQSLTAWGEEHWTTQDGKPARRQDGMHRYLPEKAWEKLSPAEKRSTEKKKREGDRKGKQFVANTAPAVKARRSAERKAPER